MVMLLYGSFSPRFNQIPFRNIVSILKISDFRIGMSKILF